MGKFREPSIGRYYQDEPQVVGRGYRAWITRGRNFAIVYTEAQAGAEVAGAFVDEQVIYIVEGRLEIAAGAERATLTGEGLAIAPPGEVAVTPRRGTRRSSRSSPTRRRWPPSPPTPGAYGDGAPEVTPRGRMADADRRLSPAHLRPGRGLRHGRHGQRLPHPQAHGDPLRPVPRAARRDRADAPCAPGFRTGVRRLEGGWIHHLRTPWTADRRDWRPDIHLELASPSTTVIPAGVIHTSQGSAAPWA
ncbi:MAG: hypothetical protein WDM92_14290 [Caulobacteraceae bacterium]